MMGILCLQLSDSEKAANGCKQKQTVFCRVLRLQQWRSHMASLGWSCLSPSHWHCLPTSTWDLHSLEAHRNPVVTVLPHFC